MISAKLIKDLEREGFRLDFPNYDSNDSRIIEILKQDNERLNLAIPLLLQYEFDYKKIINKLNTIRKNNFDKITIIANKIFQTEQIDNSDLKKIIKNNKIKKRISNDEFKYYHDSFKDFIKNTKKNEEIYFKEQIKIRGKLNLNKALSNIFAPAKLRIMKTIFNHEPLTNTELKYYYRSIRPLILSILNENLQKYLRIIESIRKLSK